MRGSLVVVIAASVLAGCVSQGKLPSQLQTAMQSPVPGAPPAWQSSTGLPVQGVTPARPNAQQVAQLMPEEDRKAASFVAKPATALPSGLVGQALPSLPQAGVPGSPPPLPAPAETAGLQALAGPNPPQPGMTAAPAADLPPGGEVSPHMGQLIAATMAQAPRTPMSTGIQQVGNQEAAGQVPATPALPPAGTRGEPGAFPLAGQAMAELTRGTAEVPASPAGAPVFRAVSSRRFTLGYQVQEPGAGIAHVEIWTTQDTQKWKKAAAEFQPPSSYAVEVDKEGVYGYILQPRSRTGESSPPPQPGASPQVWVTVDLTRPTVELMGVEMSLTSKSPSLVVRWKAGDAHFGSNPISLHYSETPEGPWRPLAASLKNTGRHEWLIAGTLPRRIYVRVEAIDQSGNTGSAQTASWLRVEQPWPPAAPTLEASRPRLPAPETATVVPAAASVPAPPVEAPAPPRIAITTVEPQ